MAEEVVVTLPEDGDEEIQWLIERLNANDAMHQATTERCQSMLTILERIESSLVDKMLAASTNLQQIVTEQQAQITVLADRLANTNLLTLPPQVEVTVIPESVVEDVPEEVAAELPEPEPTPQERQKRLKRRKL